MDVKQEAALRRGELDAFCACVGRLTFDEERQTDVVPCAYGSILGESVLRRVWDVVEFVVVVSEAVVEMAEDGELHWINSISIVKTLPILQHCGVLEQSRP